MCRRQIRPSFAGSVLTDPHVVSSYLGGDLTVINRSGEAEKSSTEAEAEAPAPRRRRQQLRAR